MALPKQYDFEVWRGNSFARLLVMKDGNGSVVDLTGSNIIIRIPNMSNGILVLKTSDASLGMPNPSAGEVEFKLTPSQTGKVIPGKVTRYECERWIADEEKTIFYGFLEGLGGDNNDA